MSYVRWTVLQFCSFGKNHYQLRKDKSMQLFFFKGYQCKMTTLPTLYLMLLSVNPLTVSFTTQPTSLEGSDKQHLNDVYIAESG